MRRLPLALILAVLAAMTARATDQTILGQKFQVKDTSIPEKRKIVGVAKEKASADTLVGDPVAGGATLTVTANGSTSTSETYPLPAGTSTITAKPFWSGDSVKGFKYADSKGENGPVKKAQIKKSGSGVFSIKVTVDAKLAPVAVVPPNLGTDACLLLELAGGDSYSVKFGDGQVKNDGARQFKISKPTIEGTCVSATTTTTTGSPTSTTDTTTSTIETTTSTADTTTSTIETTTSTADTTTSTTETTTSTIESTTTTTDPCPPGQTLCGSCVDTTNDEANCGTCGHDCDTGTVNATFTCLSSTCVFAGCDSGFWDLDHNGTCEYPCVFVSAQESCNGADDNCNGVIDEGVVSPAPSTVCGVSPSATSSECTSQVSITCVSGAWQCSFPAGVCSGGCANAVEVCDAVDNDCDGQLNENTPTYGQPCASDDGLPPPGDGLCRTTGTNVCNGPNAVRCSAVKASCATLPNGCTELPDGVDNDCDGSVDETFNAKGANAVFFVKPAVTKIGAALWIYSHEASRPTATSTTAGTGNGWVTTGAPVGVTFDKTPPASAPGRLAWPNVSGAEAEQACATVGGSLCSTAQAQSACTATASCTWAYNPRGATCTSVATGSKFCNLGAFDSNAGTPGDQDGLLATASGSLQACWADWSSLQGNDATSNKIFDLTGNLRELTKTAANSYTVLGGSYYTAVEAGAACGFTTFQVPSTFAYRDTGFRCCFTQDPRL